MSDCLDSVDCFKSALQIIHTKVLYNNHFILCRYIERGIGRTFCPLAFPSFFNLKKQRSFSSYVMLKRSQNKQHIRVETQDIRLTEEEEISQESLVMVALPLVVENEMIGTEL